MHIKEHFGLLKLSLFILLASSLCQAQEVQVHSGHSDSVHITSRADNYTADLMFTCDRGEYDVYYLNIKINNNLFPDLVLKDGETIAYTLYSGEKRLFGETYTAYVLEDARKYNETIDNYRVFIDRTNMNQYLVNGLNAEIEHTHRVEGENVIERHKVVALNLEDIMNNYPRAMSLCNKNIALAQENIEKIRQSELQDLTLFLLTEVLPIIFLVVLAIVFRNSWISQCKTFVRKISSAYSDARLSLSKRKISKIVEEEVIREKVRQEIKKQNKD